MNALSETLDYTGQYRDARKLAVSSGLIPAEKAAVMTDDEVCSKLLGKYSILAKDGETVFLVDKADEAKVRSMLKCLSR